MVLFVTSLVSPAPVAVTGVTNTAGTDTIEGPATTELSSLVGSTGGTPIREVSVLVVFPVGRVLTRAGRTTSGLFTALKLCPFVASPELPAFWESTYGFFAAGATDPLFCIPAAAASLFNWAWCAAAIVPAAGTGTTRGTTATLVATAPTRFIGTVLTRAFTGAVAGAGLIGVVPNGTEPLRAATACICIADWNVLSDNFSTEENAGLPCADRTLMRGNRVGLKKVCRGVRHSQSHAKLLRRNLTYPLWVISPEDI